MGNVTCLKFISNALLLGTLLPPFASAEDTWKGVDRIVAVGDVHGDVPALTGVLRAAGVMDRDNNWSGGKTHLVQNGDLLDRGPESRSNAAAPPTDSVTDSSDRTAIWISTCAPTLARRRRDSGAARSVASPPAKAANEPVMRAL